MFDRSLFSSRVRLKHLVPFLRQTGTMLRAGIGIRQTFDVLAKSTPSHTLRRAIRRMSERVEAGGSLEEALEDAGDVFPDMMVRVLVVGETTGGLDRMFRELADYFEWWRLTLRRLLSRLIYPAFMVFVLVHVLALLMYVGVIGGNPAALLMSFYFGVPLLVMLPKILRTLYGHSLLFDSVLLYCPVVGKYVLTLLLARFTLALGLLLEAGVGAGEALERAADSVGNEAFARGVRPAVQQILDGESFTESLERTGMFPRTFLVRLETAEQAGALVEDLHRLADDYADEARFAIELLTKGLAWGVYLLVCAVLVYYILTLASGYAGRISDLAGGV